MTERTVAVIIPALNEEHSIAQVLESLVVQRFQQATNIKVVVVDNDSTDQTAHIARKYPVEVVSVIPRNRSVARNKGASLVASTEAVLVFIDCDCRFGENFIDELTKPIFANPGCATQAFLLPRASDKPLSHLGDKFIDTKACAIRNVDFLSMEAFDPALPRCEDIDFGWRLNKKGIHFVVAMNAIVQCGELSSMFVAFHRGVGTAKGLVALHRKYSIGILRVFIGFFLIASREVRRASIEPTWKQRILRGVDSATTFVAYWLFRIFR